MWTETECMPPIDAISGHIRAAGVWAQSWKTDFNDALGTVAQAAGIEEIEAKLELAVKLQSIIDTSAHHRHRQRHMHPFLRHPHGVASMLASQDPQAISLEELARLCSESGLRIKGPD